jgi:hypothetical protein
MKTRNRDISEGFTFFIGDKEAEVIFDFELHDPDMKFVRVRFKDEKSSGIQMTKEDIINDLDSKGLYVIKNTIHTKNKL